MICSATIPPIETPARAKDAGARSRIRRAMPSRESSLKVSPTRPSTELLIASIVRLQTAESLPRPGIITNVRIVATPLLTEGAPLYTFNYG